ncbi:MFS transporter [Steroidobacter agaridevorans]|uniref:MFS transporter n=1 Tax=Steroidobacter agaridevorans TaxID=2695856 RepID=A0A829YPD0_9GAMM|nr:peptide MFS transporter [Steroidobacter agaridevorans]GFE84831.1 MFS transporter [Steroidobacter agaridevorans]GFE91812.1 MFS transporter [Steroidobacter agaridevorans]
MSTPQATWFGQPRGLAILFLTEMWEKFSFFGMRTLLVYYMTKQLLIGQENASLIYGLYAACAYLTPIAGGYIADRWLGTRRAVIAGGAIMSVGHFMMASEALFLPALATIALGNGLFLPNLPSQIHGLYSAQDPRRGPAYNLYYAGVNLGAFFAPLICGTLGELYGWHYGFGAAGIGMLLGLLIYVGGARYLPPDTPRAAAQSVSERSGDVTRQIVLLVSIALVVVVFRGAYEQIGNTFAIWADQGVDRRISAELTIPMTWFQSLNPMFVFLLTPVLVIAWTRAARRGRDPSPLVKMAIGAALVASAYLMLALVLSVQASAVSWLWAALFVLLLTAGELFILPTGLALFGQLAPRRFAATVMALWFLGSFGGNLLAGVLGSLWTSMGASGFFVLMSGVAGLAAVLLLVIGRRVTEFPESQSMEFPQARRDSVTGV